MNNNKSVHFISLGCPKNLVDTEIMVGSLMGNGYQVTQEPEQAKTVIINTCGFVEDSKKESIQKILEMGELKSKGIIDKLVVAGCLTQRYKNDLVTELPEADLFIGSGEFQNIHKILEAYSKGDQTKTFFNLPTFLQSENSPRINTQPSHRAYLKIAEGCLKRCAFCAIPLIRGNLQSRTLSSIRDEALKLVDQGVKELNIISHDFTDYGWDIRKKNPKAQETPVEVLRVLSDIKGLEWIRVLYLYPDGITPEMIQLIKERPNLVKYFDMPLQHINNDVLKRMNRKMTREEIETVLMNIRDQIPEAVIRTQFILGFPGETEQQFEELMDFIITQEIDRVGAFKYSMEENTPAGKMLDQVEESIKEERFNILMSVQQKISKAKHKAHIGRIERVVVEGLSEETELLLQGRTSQQAPDIDGIVLINEGHANVGDFVNVEITESMEYDLIGRIVE
ncbi:MAG TPA: 30S ribosomal protein S12 methylthiotransferase RimO [Pseudobdellovibrionaceae bacterium]|nr:30S ribosomal protein S12 methylthiotransferase RimO [Pseudobdellovibrionaceae bacterium]